MSNLTPEVTDSMLGDIFRNANFNVMKAKLLMDATGKSKCSGFVELASVDDAAAAAGKMNGSQQGPKRLLVQIAKS